MKKVYLCLTIFICSTAFSQSDSKEQKEIQLANNTEEYNALLRVTDAYKTKTENELKNINYLKSQAHNYIDSAKVITSMEKRDNSISKTYEQNFYKYINYTSTLIKKADSVIAKANVYKDSVYINIAEANNIRKAIIEEEEDQKAESFNLNYVVQLGAGNLNSSYFSKVKEVKVVKSSSGVNRYVVGLFNTKDEAIAYKEKMVQLGYTDAIIRTMDSLYQ